VKPVDSEIAWVNGAMLGNKKIALASGTVVFLVGLVGVIGANVRIWWNQA
jgi:hypothetical protein